MVSTVQTRGFQQIMNRMKEYAILETTTWTIGAADGHKTASSKAKTAINCIVQDLKGDDYNRMSAGHLAKSDKIIWVANDVTLYSPEITAVSGSDIQQFIYYPGDGTTTAPSGARIYKVTEIPRRGKPGDYSPDNSTNANLAYTKAYLAEVFATG